VGLHYFGKRYLNTHLGRWISPDPLAIHAPGEADLNLYAYVSGHVLKSVDPLGLEEKSGGFFSAAKSWLSETAQRVTSSESAGTVRAAFRGALSGVATALTPGAAIVEARSGVELAEAGEGRPRTRPPIKLEEG
jgi:uncharacterized protein RhaS with RHS repeats